MSLCSHVEPNTYSEAMKHNCWRKATPCEIFYLELNQTWDNVLLPKNKTVIDCKWVFIIKYKTDETVERYKTRLMAKGYTINKGH